MTVRAHVIGRAARLAVVVAAVAALAAPAAAQSTGEPAWVEEKEDQARQLVRQANAERQAYVEAGETGPRTFASTFREAAGLLQEIVTVAPTAKRLYGLAFARFHAGEAERAHFACDRVSREFPAAERVIQRCEALTAVLHDEVYRVLVDSEPQGAAVSVEGWPEDDAVQTPGVLWLRAGPRKVVFRLEGYQPQTQAVSVESGFVTQVKARLLPVPETGRVEIVVQPPDARVLVDGAPVVIPLNGIIELPVGDHVVRVEAEGFLPQEETVAVTAGGMTSRWYELEGAPVDEPDEPDAPDRPYWEQPELAPEPGMTTMAILGWTGVGVGAAAIVAGGAMHGLAVTKADDARGVPNLPGRRAEFESKRDDARLFETTAYALYGAGAAVATAGVLLVVLDPGHPDETEGTTVAPTASRDGFGVTLTTRF